MRAYWPFISDQSLKKHVFSDILVQESTYPNECKRYIVIFVELDSSTYNFDILEDPHSAAFLEKSIFVFQDWVNFSSNIFNFI
jgi:hypothetical protein